MKLSQIALLTFANSIYAATIVFILLPNQFADGGIVGISLLVHYFTQWPTELIYIVLNIPIFILGWKQLGRKAILLSVYSIIIMTISIRFFTLINNQNPTFPHTHDPINLSPTIIAGICIGYSLGIILRMGATTGGIDIIALIIHKKTNRRISHLLITMDILIVLFSLLIISISRVLYTTLFLFLSALILDLLIHHNKKKTKSLHE